MADAITEFWFQRRNREAREFCDKHSPEMAKTWELVHKAQNLACTNCPLQQTIIELLGDVAKH